MSTVAPDEMKEIGHDRWEEWADIFTNGNHGRLIELANDAVLGDTFLAEGVPLVAIDYDPPDKGNAFIISYGSDEAPVRHVVNAPVALWQGQDKNGLVVAVSIEDSAGKVTMIKLA